MKLKEKMKQLEWKVECKYRDLTYWCKENKEIIVICGPVIAGSVIELVKIATRQHRVNEERELKDKYVYDRKMGNYYYLRRKPKSQEWLIINQRRENGEDLGSILASMRLLK